MDSKECDSWETYDDVRRDMWALSDFQPECQISARKPPPPSTIEINKADVQRKTNCNAYFGTGDDDDDDEAVEYCKPIRGHPMNHDNPPLLGSEKTLEEYRHNVRKLIREKVNGYGFSDDVIMHNLGYKYDDFKNKKKNENSDSLYVDAEDTSNETCVIPLHQILKNGGKKYNYDCPDISSKKEFPDLH